MQVEKQRNQITPFPVIMVAVFAATVSVWASAHAADAEQTADAKNDSPPPYLRVQEEPGVSLALQIAERVFVPAEGEHGPRLALVAVAHIGETSFYDELQQSLNTYDLVLYESVTPAGTSEVHNKDLTASERVERTHLGMQLVTSLLHAWFDDKQHFPSDLAELREYAVQRQPRLDNVLRHAFVDGWGHKLRYRPNEEQDGFELISFGADGEPGGEGSNTDRHWTQDKATDVSPFDEQQQNLQGELAQALGLAFQLNAIDYSASNWRVADMSMDELQRELADRGVHFAPLEGALAGSSIPARVAKFILRMIPVLDSWTEGRVTDIFKIVLIEVLGDESLMQQSLGQLGDAFTEVIINQRNQIALEQLRPVLANEPDVESVAIFYGAGHMPDLQQRLADQFNYTEARDAVTWRTAIRVNIERSAIPPAQIEQMRRNMRRLFKQSMRQPMP